MNPPADDTQTLTIRLPRALYEQLRREAFERHTSMNAIVVEALAQRKT